MPNEPSKPDAKEREIFYTVEHLKPDGVWRHFEPAAFDRKRDRVESYRSQVERVSRDGGFNGQYRVARYVPESALLSAQLALLDDLARETRNDWSKEIRLKREQLLAQLAAQSGEGGT